MAEVALALEFLVQDLRAVLSLVPALLQVVKVRIQGGGLAGRAAHHFLPSARPSVLAHGAAVQAEFPCHRAMAPAGSGQGLHGLEQSSGRSAQTVDVTAVTRVPCVRACGVSVGFDAYPQMFPYAEQGTLRMLWISGTNQPCPCRN